MKSYSDAELVLATMLKTFNQEPESTIVIRDAWVESPHSVCVVYDDTRYKLGTLGRRITFPPHAREGDPGSTGEDAAMNIIEPLGGSVTDYMRLGPMGITWLWSGNGDFPIPPRWRPKAE